MVTRSRTLVIFYILVAYILIQLLWWAWLLLEQNREIYDLKIDLNLQKGGSEAEVMQKGNELLNALHKKWAMIAGEGMVFLGLLLVGVAMTRKSIKKENDVSELQKNFLLSVTHELRTPLASLKLQMDTLLKRELDPLKQKEMLRDCLSDTERLASLVENILLASKMENQKVELMKESCDLSVLTASCIEKARTLTATSHLITLTGEPDIKASIDKTAYQSIVLNLLENATKYSPAGSEIILKLSKANNRAILSVSDTGSGIRADEKQKIFTRFYRGGNEETRRTKGTGLGLFITKALVESHGGMIKVRDNSPSGCIFEVRLPL